MQRRSIFQMLGFTLPAREEGEQADPGALIRYARETLTPDPLTLDSVYRAISIIQTAAIQVSLDEYRDNEKLTGGAKSNITRKPDPETSYREFIRSTVSALAQCGNAYWRIFTTSRKDRKEVAVVRVLDPTLCNPYRDKNGNRKVGYQGKEYGLDEIAHIRLFEVPGEVAGLGPIQAARRMLGGAVKTEEAATTWLSKGGVPTGILKTDAVLDAEEIQEHKAAWNKSASQDNGVAVLTSGLEYQQLLRPADIQFLESRGYDARAISRLFGIPSYLMNVGIEGNSMTYQNLQDAHTSFVTWTLMQYFAPIEDALTNLLPGNRVARFNLEAFLRADIKKRFETYQIGISNGIYSVEEVRAIEGLD